MKLLSDNGSLQKLIQLIKSTFVNKNDVSELAIDNEITENSNNLITSGAVYEAIGDVESILISLRGGNAS